MSLRRWKFSLYGILYLINFSIEKNIKFSPTLSVIQRLQQQRAAMLQARAAAAQSQQEQQVQQQQTQQQQGICTECEFCPECSAKQIEEGGKWIEKQMEKILIISRAFEWVGVY